jgi:UDP-N-acetylmuramoyl-tripeptide--D-alanyl-D-alanine ligase
MNIEDLYRIYCNHPQIQTDSRKLASGDLFFALRGPNFNGNQFALQALEMGAAYVIVDEQILSADKTFLVRILPLRPSRI